MQRKLIAGAIAASISAVLILSLINTASSQAPMTTTVRDSSFVLLEGKKIPAKDFIHLYDATPQMIMSGHVAAKLPCNDKGESALKIVVGQAPKVAPADMELIKELSSPGKMCIYHVDIPPKGVAVLTDIALLNPTEKGIRLPATSTVVVSVSEVMPLGSMHM